MERIFSISEDLVQGSNLKFKRYLYHNISLKSRVTGIAGSDGVGKTSLLLQLMGNRLGRDKKALYINMNDLVFSRKTLFEFAAEFYRKGGEALFIDDLQKYGSAADELEDIYKNFEDLRLVFTTSILPWEDGKDYFFIKELDLYNLRGLSFREFLEFKYDYAFPVIKFDELLELNRNPGVNVLNRIRPLQFFDEYLRSGYYMLRHDSLPLFQQQVNKLVNRMLEGDLASVYRAGYDSVIKIRKMLGQISLEGPIRPNIEKLARENGTTRDSLLKFIGYTNSLGITNCIYNPGSTDKKNAKPGKIYLGNSNLAAAFNPAKIPPESMYETFLINQISSGHRISNVGSSDGIIRLDGEYRMQFEWMNHNQTKQSHTDYYIVPDLDYQRGTRIPLWMFGFLY